MATITDTLVPLATLGPQHPIDVMERIAYATPCPCEGSVGHLRGDFAWEIRDDHRRAIEADAGVLDDYDDGVTFEQVRASCVKDAVNAIIRWTAEAVA